MNCCHGDCRQGRDCPVACARKSFQTYQTNRMLLAGAAVLTVAGVVLMALAFAVL